MNSYSKNSSKRISTAHKDLFKLFTRILQVCDHTIVYGRRSMGEQNALFSKGRTIIDGRWIITNKNRVVTYKQWPNSTHNVKDPDDLAIAIDAAPYMHGRLVNGDQKGDIEQLYYFAGVVKGTALEMYKNNEISHQLKWGGDWDNDYDVNDQNFNDLFHFQLIKNG